MKPHSAFWYPILLLCVFGFAFAGAKFQVRSASSRSGEILKLAVLNLDTIPYDSLEVRVYMRAPEKGPATYPELNTTDAGPIPFPNHFAYKLDTLMVTNPSGSKKAGPGKATIYANLRNARPVRLPNSFDPNSNTHLYYIPIPFDGVSLPLLSTFQLNL